MLSSVYRDGRLPPLLSEPFCVHGAHMRYLARRRSVLIVHSTHEKYVRTNPVCLEHGEFPDEALRQYRATVQR